MSDDKDPRVTPFATHWGVYHAETRDGRLVGLRDYVEDPDPSEIGPGLLDMIDHPTRIRRPAIREGFLARRAASDRAGRGAEPFVEVPWDEALDIAAEEIVRVRAEHGSQAIYGGSYGWSSAGRFHHAQSQLRRFLNCGGGYTASVDTYSFAAVSALTPHVVGHFRNFVVTEATSWASIAEHCELVLAIGGLAVKNAQVNSGGVGRHTTRGWLRRARENGVAFVNVSPLRSDVMDELGAEWLAPRPNTDAALLIALAHTLLTEDLHDEAFLETYCVGFDRYSAYLLGESDGRAKDADWAAEITELPAETIRSLARRLATSRSMIAVSWSVQRADHGEQPSWAAIALAAMLGQIGLPGGGFGFGYANENGVGNPAGDFKFAALPQLDNPVATSIPVARISDALLHPGEPYQFNGQDLTYPDLRLVYWAGGNPFHHHQDLNRLIRAFRRPETIIVNEIWWTAMARHADVVFPATTALEREDFAAATWEPAVVAMRRALPPFAEARDDYAIFSGLAQRLGLEQVFTEGRDPEAWIRHLWDQTRQRAAEGGYTLPGLEMFREQEIVTLPEPEAPSVLMEKFREDPATYPLSTPSGRIEIHSERIAGFDYEDCPGHPSWIEPYEWLGAPQARRFPLHLISNQPKTRLHAQFDPGRVSLASKIAGREPIALAPRDAAARGIADGDVVRVWNERGACLAGAIVTDAVRPGVVQMATGAWYDPETPGQIGSLCKHGSVNVLTRDQGTSLLGQGPSAQTTLVEVEKIKTAPPPITVFFPPKLRTK